MSTYHIPVKPEKRIRDLIKECMSCNSKTGIIVCIKSIGRRKVGDRLDTPAGKKYNYRQVRFKLPGEERFSFLAHHVAWFLYNGKWPRYTVDHHDGNGGNNRKRNLRKATTSQNAYNTKTSTRNTSGVRGVSKMKVKDKRSGVQYDYWTARISIAGKRYELGTFKEYDDAVAARLKAEKENYKDRAFSARPAK